MTKRMAATAADLIDAVIPRVSMRQWMLTLSKPLRPALRGDPVLATRVLIIFIDSIERSLRVCSEAPPSARPGAVSFLKRFGSALNEHWHYHRCVSDGVFDTADYGSLRFVFATIDAQSAAKVQARVRRRVLAAYRRRGWLDAVCAANTAEWDHGGGFSVDASVAIHSNDRAGRHVGQRYAARPGPAKCGAAPTSATAILTPSSQRSIPCPTTRTSGKT